MKFRMFKKLFWENSLNVFSSTSSFETNGSSKVRSKIKMRHEKLFAIQLCCFKVSGFGDQRISLKIVQLCLTFILMFCTTSEIMFIVKNRRNVLASAEAFGPLATAIIGLVKIITFYVSLKKFYVFIEKIQKMGKEGLSRLK